MGNHWKTCGRIGGRVTDRRVGGAMQIARGQAGQEWAEIQNPLKGGLKDADR